MNLIIDAGNTKVKLAVFKQDVLVFKSEFLKEAWKKGLLIVEKEYKEVDNCIVSSVTNLEASFLEALHKEYKTLILGSDTQLPFKNLYKTPKTLGVDRIALVSAAAKQFPKKNALIIDAGTCITYDFKNKENEYLGGAISPGLQMRYKAIHNQTAKLPNLEAEMPGNFIGGSTNESIHSGISNGIKLELEGVIRQYQEKYSHLTVILTGGDTYFFAKSLKNGIFAHSNFLLEGLNTILELNKHK
jgi:type III pantothenate kinase